MSRKATPKSVPNNDANVARTPRVTNKLSLKLKIDDLKTFQPLTDNQKLFFDEYDNGNEVMILTGSAGTGKTFIAVYKSLEEVMDKSNVFDKIVLIRSAVQTRSMGHTPGSDKEKMSLYESPYHTICGTLFGRKDAYTRLNEQGYVEFASTSFLRGETFDNSIVIVDEFQSMTFHELSTIFCRVGYDSKIIFCGDTKQNDLITNKNDVSGIKDFLKVIDHMRNVVRVNFTSADIVRSELVKEFIIAAEACGL